MRKIKEREPASAAIFHVRYGYLPSARHPAGAVSRKKGEGCPEPGFMWE